MKTAIALVLGAGMSLAASAAAAETRGYQIAGFDKVHAMNHVRVVLKQGPFSVTVHEPDGRFDDVRLSVRDGVLHASRRDRYSWFWFQWRDRPEYTVTVTAPSIVEAAAYDHGKLQANLNASTLRLVASDHGKLSGQFTASTLDARANDHGDIEGAFSVGRFTVSASDHGDVRYSGRCRELTVDAYDHGEVDGFSLQCDAARVVARGHADVSVHASKTVYCEAFDHGGIRTYGPGAVTVGRVDDHGSIRRL